MFNKLIVGALQFLPKSFVWIFSKRYIAGEKLEEAISTTKSLNKEKIKATMDLLGEFLTRIERIEEYKNEYVKLIEHSVKEGLDNSFSIKPSMFGLLLDDKLCYKNLREILLIAVSHNRFIRLDMEDSCCTTQEIELYKKLLLEFPKNIGIVLQAYLMRTKDDLMDLIKFDNGNNNLNIRICKGIYNEAPSIAFKDKNEINRHYLENLELMFKHNVYAAIATHDKELIEGAYMLVKQYKVPLNRFEFQMLYGVTPERRKSIVEKGYTMRVYVPYGKDWFNYSTRRLKENPRMISHMIKALFVRS